MSYVFAIPIIFIIIVAFLKYRIIKEEEIEENERRKIAEELLLFCKDTHTFWEIKNNLIKIPVQNVGINNLPNINTSSLEEDITYFHLFDIAFDIQRDVNEDSELKIILYYSAVSSSTSVVSSDTSSTSSNSSVSAATLSSLICCASA